jgi:hypothetical protein
MSIKLVLSILVLGIKRYCVLPFKVFSCRCVLKVSLDGLLRGLLLVANAVAEVREFVHVEPKTIERQ